MLDQPRIYINHFFACLNLYKKHETDNSNKKTVYTAMLIIVHLCQFLGFNKKIAYRIKLAGDEELYLVKINSVIRMIKSTDLDYTNNIINVVSIKQNIDNYFIEFCGFFLSAKEADPGIVPRKLQGKFESWFIKEVGNGYQIINGNNCLTKMEAYDTQTRGYYLNSQPCNKYATNVFSVLDAGFISNFCSSRAEKNDKKLICQVSPRGSRRDKFFKRDGDPNEDYDRYKGDKDVGNGILADDMDIINADEPWRKRHIDDQNTNGVPNSRNSDPQKEAENLYLDPYRNKKLDDGSRNINNKRGKKDDEKFRNTNRNDWDDPFRQIEDERPTKPHPDSYRDKFDDAYRNKRNDENTIFEEESREIPAFYERTHHGNITEDEFHHHM